MKLHESFEVSEPVEEVWRFFEHPELVAGCMPGVEAVDVVDPDNVAVRATQAIGPLTATFEAKVRVLERVDRTSIRFRATGKTVRGAMGNITTTNEVHLAAAEGGGTVVSVDGDVVLAGALGSVGQKIVARQAGKVTAEFADNLAAALRGEPAPQPAARAARRAGGALGQAVGGSGAPDHDLAAAGTASDRWSRVAAAVSLASLVVNVVVLWRLRHRRQA